MNPKPILQHSPFLSQYGITVDILRLDQIHPIVSGNKWYKLKYYLESAIQLHTTHIASFGGPYSNHLVALSFAAQQHHLKSIGYVRANQGEPITPTLQEAIHYGMQLIFIGRSDFQEKKQQLLQNASNNSSIYFVDEGGYGMLGAKGAATILEDVNKESTLQHPMSNYNKIICAVGTGTMMAGIIQAATPIQEVIGIPVLKNEGSIQDEIKALLQNPIKPFTLLHDFHQGGYAKSTPKLFEFMNQLWLADAIPTDFVYTGKLMYAVEQLLKLNYFETESKLLVIHSGGLQGNRSLTKGELLF